MKPTSIIFLVISVILVFGGYFTMQAAEKLAAEDGVELLTVADAGEYRFEHEFDDEEIGKIAINVKDAKVNIYGGASESKIELVNFADGLYEFTNTNRVLTVSNNSDFSTIDSIANLVMSFKGIRSLVNYYNIRELEKTVNIHIAADSGVKIVSLELDEGEVVIEGGTTMTDYNVKLGRGSLSLSKVETGSSVNAELPHGSLTADDCVVSHLVAKVGKGDVNISASDVSRFDCEVDSGDVSMSYRYDFGYVNLDLFTGDGEVTIDGQLLGGYFEDTEKPSTALYDIRTEKGDIELKSNDYRMEQNYKGSSD